MNANERLKMLQKELGFNSQESFAQALGIKQGTLSGIYNSAKGVGVSGDIKRILEKQYSVNIEWLETGIGDAIAIKAFGIPYFDVDFTGSFDSVVNNQTTTPDYYIDLNPFNIKGGIWCNLSGKSMQPEIDPGDKILVSEVHDWINGIIMGEMYGIVTDEFRTVKRVRKSDKPNHIRLVPSNKAEYDEQDLPLDVIKRVYRVIGSVKTF